MPVTAVRRAGLVGGLLLLTGVLTACGGPGAQPVRVLYAGSLVHLMERGLGPAFGSQSGRRVLGYAGGSLALAYQVEGHLRRADVFLSADPSVDQQMALAAHGSWVSWYATFAQAPLVVAYRPTARMEALFGSQPWYLALQEPGLRVGRTDPQLDPKGALTVTLLERAAMRYHAPALDALLSTGRDGAQIFPEDTLLGRLESGQLDAGFFYRSEAVQAHLPYVTPATSLDPGAVFTVTVLRGAPDPTGAVAFVRFLLGSRAAAIMNAGGLDVVRPVLAGDARAVPPGLRALLPGRGS